MRSIELALWAIVVAEFIAVYLHLVGLREQGREIQINRKRREDELAQRAISRDLSLALLAETRIRLARLAPAKTLETYQEKQNEQGG